MTCPKCHTFRYAVHVGNIGNIGNVLSTDSLDEARTVANIYIVQSNGGFGRAGGESVCIINNTSGDLVLDYAGSLASEGD